MKTDDLIRALAADTTLRRPVFPDALIALFLPILILGVIFLWLAEIRPDLISAILAPVTMWKWVLPMMIALGGMAVAGRLSRPEGLAGGWRLLLWFAAAIALWLVIKQMREIPRTDWLGALKGDSLFFCLASIIAIGLPGLIAVLLVLRRGATTRASFAGLAAGLGCGGVATVIYALHCDEDAPLFFVTWYGGAICLLGLAGAALGHRMLRW